MIESEKLLKELNESVKKDIQDGKNEIIWILKTIMFISIITLFITLIFSIFK